MSNWKKCSKIPRWNFAYYFYNFIMTLGLEKIKKHQQLLSSTALLWSIWTKFAVWLDFLFLSIYSQVSAKELRNNLQVSWWLLFLKVYLPFCFFYLTGPEELSWYEETSHFNLSFSVLIMYWKFCSTSGSCFNN